MWLLTAIFVVFLGWLLMSHSHGQIAAVRGDIAVMNREIAAMNDRIGTLNRDVGLIADTMDAVVRFAQATSATMGIHLERLHGLEVEAAKLPGETRR